MHPATLARVQLHTQYRHVTPAQAQALPTAQWAAWYAVQAPSFLPWALHPSHVNLGYCPVGCSCPWRTSP
jgi:hypothetical protein